MITTYQQFNQQRVCEKLSLKYIFSIENSVPIKAKTNKKMINYLRQLRQLPFISRILFLTLVFTYILSISTNFPQKFLPNTIDKTIFSFQIWRLFTTHFYLGNIIVLLLLISSLKKFLPRLELINSTPVMLIQIGTASLNIQLGAMTIQLVRTLITERFYYNNIGLYGIWVYLAYKYCYYNPHGKIHLLCNFYQIQRRHYPLVLIIVIFVNTYSFDVFMGLIVAWYQNSYMQAGIIRISRQTYLRFDYSTQNNGLLLENNWIRLKDCLRQALIYDEVISTRKFYQNTDRVIKKDQDRQIIRDYGGNADRFNQL